MTPTYVGPGVIDTEERKQVYRRLTDALYDYLALPIVEMERAQSQSPQYGPALTPEMLIKAQESVEYIQSQMDAIEAIIEKVPSEDVRGLMRVGMLPMYEQQLRQAQEWLTHVQTGLENVAKEKE